MTKRELFCLDRLVSVARIIKEKPPSALPLMRTLF